MPARERSVSASSSESCEKQRAGFSWAAPWMLLAFTGVCGGLIIRRRGTWVCVQWECRSPSQPSDMEWALLEAFLRDCWLLGSGFTSSLDVSPCCCGYRSDTGKLWQIPRMSGGEHRSLWKMPSSLVSSMRQSGVQCSGLSMKCWSTAFLSSCPALIRCKVWHDVWPGLLVSALTSRFLCPIRSTSVTALWFFLFVLRYSQHSCV